MQPHLHPRYKFILWLALQRRLATVDRLIKFGVQVSQNCVFYKQSDELFEHLFFDCPIVREIWTRLLKWLVHSRPIQTWHEEVQWINRVAKKRSGHWAIVAYVFGMLVYTIWTERNVIRFQGGILKENSICREIVMCIHTRGRTIKSWQGALQELDYFPLGS
ncbi:uncharacterized protein [Nicotiana sylvestris]|uniref:uncharacterized protein n=1 Tax=Nicotiana sylvestris TaxID=4096 RepID=UPI00388C57FD